MITNLVKEFRIKIGLTQEELASAVKVSRQTIIAIEKGNYTPSLLLAMALAKQFNISVEQLFAIKSWYNKPMNPVIQLRMLASSKLLILITELYV